MFPQSAVGSMHQAAAWLPNAVSSTGDAQAPSIEDVLYLLTRCPNKIAGIGLF